MGSAGSILGGVGRCAPGVAPMLPRRSRPARARARGRTIVTLPARSRGGGAPGRGADVPAAEGNSASETLFGSDMPFSHFKLFFENARCFRPCLLPLKPSSNLNPVRLPRYTFGCGVHPRARSHARRCGAAFACPPLAELQCGAEGRHGCGAEVGAYGDHHLAAPAQVCCLDGDSLRRGRGLIQVAREAVGPQGRVVPQQWLSPTTAAHIHADDRRRLDVVYCGTTTFEALCCDATLVFSLTRARGRRPGGGHAVAARRRKVARYLELTRGGPRRPVVLAAAIPPHPAPAPRPARTTTLAHRRGAGGVCRAVASSAIGVCSMLPLPGAPDTLPLGDVLDLASASAPSRLPLR